MEMKKELIDTDIVNSLRGLYFGSAWGEGAYKAAVFRAYLDFSRTIKFCNAMNDQRLERKEYIVSLFEKQIKELHSRSVSTQEDFDTWHGEVCENIIDNYKGVATLTYGQAQKWVNMTIKYLYLLSADPFEKEFSFLHIPIDRYVIDAAKKLGVKKPGVAWSALNDDGYKNYQQALRTAIQKKYPNTAPLRWEFGSWLEAAKGIGDN